MNRKKKRTLVACVLAFSLMTLAACQHHGERRHHSDTDRGRLASHVVAELELDSGQATQIRALLSNLDGKRDDQGHRAQIRNLFVSQLKNEVFDEEHLRDETSKLIRELEAVSEKFIADLGAFHSTLSEEQRGKLVSMMSRGKGPKSRHH